MHKILKYQTPSGTIPATYIEALKDKMPSFSASATTTKQPGLAGITGLGLNTKKRNSAYLDTFGYSYDDLNKAGLNMGSYENAEQLSADIKAAEKSGALGSGSASAGSGMSADLKAGLGAAGQVLGQVEDMAFQNTRYAKSAIGGQAHDVRKGISDAAIQSGIPIAMAIGAATKLVDGAMDATGMRSDTVSKDLGKKAGLSGAERFLNNAMNFLPGNPLAMGGAKITDSEKSIEAEKLRGAYTGTLSDMDSAAEIGGGRLNFMLGGARDKMNKFVEEQNRRNNLLTSISMTNTLRKQSDYSQELNSQNFNRYNGKNYQSTAVGKDGLSLPDKELLLRIYSARKTIEEVPQFKGGGVIGIDSNVIPEGALHKELNHMKEYNEELDKVITDKGIAVVVTNEEGKPEQVAEIEKEEIVLRKKLTKVIEELWKDGSEEAMLKAGKLLAKEIIGNTDDNTEEMLDGDN